MEGFYIISIIIQKTYMKNEYWIVIIMVMVMIIITIINIHQAFHMSNIALSVWNTLSLLNPSSNAYGSYYDYFCYILCMRKPRAPRNWITTEVHRGRKYQSQDLKQLDFRIHVINHYLFVNIESKCLLNQNRRLYYLVDT